MKPENKKEQTQAHRTALDEPDVPLSCSERHRPCSTAPQCTVVPRSGRRGRRVQVLPARPSLQVADLRECRFLGALFHSPAIATEASWEKWNAGATANC